MDREYIYEAYEPQDEIPSSILNEGRSMYFESYLNPKLHEGIPLDVMQIDTSQFHSYDAFISDMFLQDFSSYQLPGKTPRIYLQARRIQDSKIIGICAVLELANHNYYLDHLGVHQDFRRHKIASTLIQQLIEMVPNFKAITLDTRVFNRPAQHFYEKTGFKKLDTHPNSRKQFTYYHYILEQPK